MLVSPNVSRSNSETFFNLLFVLCKTDLGQYPPGFVSVIYSLANSQKQFAHSFIRLCWAGRSFLKHVNLITPVIQLLESLPNVPMLLTLDQVAQELTVSKRSVQRLISSGQLEALHLSPALIRVRDTALTRYLDNLQRSQRLAGKSHV